MITRCFAIFLGLVALTACEEVPTAAAPQVEAPRTQIAPGTVNEIKRQFTAVQRRVEPVAEQECNRRTTQVNCDFKVVINEDPNQPSNAYQTLDANNRPVIIFNIALLRETSNADEVAFIMGHEAAHHIESHIEQSQQHIIAGAILAAGIAALAGGDASAVEAASDLGARVGSRTYSKEFELEADALGTVITKLAGYDPLRGAQFFNRIPDPGDRFLGSHPPNAERLATVRRVASQL